MIDQIDRMLGLAAPGQKKPFLQGWAVVENQTDNDWNNVELSLVSGRPISFIQDLYQPLYVPRPVVQPRTRPAFMPRRSTPPFRRPTTTRIASGIR